MNYWDIKVVTDYLREIGEHGPLVLNFAKDRADMVSYGTDWRLAIRRPYISKPANDYDNLPPEQDEDFD